MLQIFTKIILIFVLLCFSLEASAEMKILVSPKGNHASFWTNVGQGAVAAGKELGAEITIRGPKFENDYEGQARIIRFGIAKDFDAIVLAPTHDQYLEEALMQAIEKGIKVVLVDSGLDSAFQLPLVASDNSMGGSMAAEYLGSLLDESGKVILARHLEGHVSTQKREQAFKDTLSTHYPQLAIAAEPYVGLSRGEAYYVIKAHLKEQKIDGIFCDSEEASLGIIKALKDMPAGDKPKFIGFDFNQTIHDAIQDGIMDATIVQNPYQMGYQGTLLANRMINDQDVPTQHFTDLLLVTRENISTPAVQQVIGQYLPASE